MDPPSAGADGLFVPVLGDDRRRLGRWGRSRLGVAV